MATGKRALSSMFASYGGSDSEDDAAGARPCYPPAATNLSAPAFAMCRPVARLQHESGLVAGREAVAASMGPAAEAATEWGAPHVC
jgi:hypothetical protein